MNPTETIAYLMRRERNRRREAREHELDQRREDRREVHGQYERQDIPEREPERPDREVRIEDLSRERDGRHEQAEVVERPDNPHDRAERAQPPLSTSLEAGTVICDHAEPDQRPDPQHERDEPLRQSTSGDEHHREIAARQDARSDQPRQAHVAGGVGHQRDEDPRQRQLEQILAHARRRRSPAGNDQLVQTPRPHEPAKNSARSSNGR